MTSSSNPLPENFETLSTHDVDLLIPALSKDPQAISSIETKLKALPTTHKLVLGDSRDLSWINDSSIGLVVTSPPYWTLKKYNECKGQLAEIQDYDEFLSELDKVWTECYRVLIPGGRLIIVVGDVCLSRRKHQRHRVMSLHADIQVHCRNLGYDNLAPIFWYKVANASYEAKGNGAGFLGKPYEPNAVLKNDVEFILMQRKPGGYRKIDNTNRLLSIISGENYRKWFKQVWGDVQGERIKNHPAAYPEELATRLVRMFSFAGDIILDPFNGTATTMLVAAKWGRNSIGVEIDPTYFENSKKRLTSKLGLDLVTKHILHFESRQVQSPSTLKPSRI